MLFLESSSAALLPIRVARAAVVVATYPGSADLAAALVRYDDDNQKIFDLLTLSMAHCSEGRAVMNEFGFNPALADAANPAKYADDGLGIETKWILTSESQRIQSIGGSYPGHH